MSLQRACTLEAELALLLRLSHKYGKSGAQVLYSMGTLEHIASCRAVNFQVNYHCLLAHWYYLLQFTKIETELSTREV